MTTSRRDVQYGVFSIKDGASAISGIGGALYVFTVGFVSPQSFALHQLVVVITIVVVGGRRRLLGVMP